MIQPRDITNEINKRPPLQREDVEKSYENIKVNWKLEFWNATKIYIDVNKLMINTTPEKDMFPDVLFEINKNEYPGLNILNQHDFLWVEGDISKVNGLQITLKNVTIKFKDEEKNTQSLDFGSSTFINSQPHLDTENNIKIKEKNILSNVVVVGDNKLGEKLHMVKLNHEQKDNKDGRNFWEKSWFQIIILLSALSAIVSLIKVIWF